MNRKVNNQLQVRMSRQKNKQVEFCWKEREDSDEEDDIPLMELAKRIKSRENPESDEEYSSNNMDPLPDDTSSTERKGQQEAQMESKKISNDQELIQPDPISCPQ